MLDIKFPIKYYEDNKIFTHASEAWAYFEMDGYEYDYLSIDRKLRISRRLRDFLATLGFETHLLIASDFFSVEDIHEDTKTRLNGDLKEIAINHLDDAAVEIKKINGEEDTSYRYFIGVKLPKFDYESNDLKGIVEHFKDLKNKFFNFFSLEELDITKEEYERSSTKANALYEIMQGFFTRIHPVSSTDIQWLIKRNFFRSIGRPPINENFIPTSEETENGKKISAPELLRLSEGIVNTGKTGEISITQMVEGVEKTGYTAFLNVAHIPSDELDEIGHEWLYLSQTSPTIDFPVDISIRTTSIKHTDMKTKIENTKKEINSERENAAQVGNDISTDVQESERLIHDLESSVKNSRAETFETSIVFAVTASTREELQSRINSLVTEYKEHQIVLEQSGSDQWLLFNEFLPGAEKYVKDYNRIMEPAMLAAGMFGATKNIGDNRGFYIGNELTKGQPVYIDPAMAAKNLVKTKSKSLSASFLGPPGGGKSFAANLITYLSVLTGGYAFIVDPKNDRTYWEESLIYIKDHVNVITLTGEEKNQGRLDPFLICETLDRAQALAVNICTFLTQSSLQDESFTYISEAAEEVTKMESPCMIKLIEFLLNHNEPEAVKTGKRLKVFTRLSFARLLFGDGTPVKQLNAEYKINVLQIANLKLPDQKKSVSNYNFDEMLSMAMMFPIGEFAHDFMHSLPREIFKIIFFDESWFMEKTDIGTEIINQLQREGRARNAGIYRATQAINDVDAEGKSMTAMKFIFQNNDVSECQNALKYLGLDPEDPSNIESIQELDTGECLFQDVRGRTAKIKIMHLFADLEIAFDTRPPSAIQSEEMEETIEVIETEEQELVNV